MVEEITFEGVQDKLESKESFNRQSAAKYLRLTEVFM